jgi:hypothetical protein
MKHRKDPKKHAKRSVAARARSAMEGIILERFKRIQALPAHRLDWHSQFFMTHFLGAKKGAPNG